MDKQQISFLVLAIVVALVGVYDVYASLFLPAGHTVSKLFFDMSQKYPIIPFLLGLLIGHTLWQND